MVQEDRKVSIAHEVTNNGQRSGDEVYGELKTRYPFMMPESYGFDISVYRFEDGSALVETARPSDDELFFYELDEFTYEGLIKAAEILNSRLGEDQPDDLDA